MSEWPEMFFARHGETEWNREKRYQGTMDIPLNATGRTQADANGPLLVEMLGARKLDPRQMDWFASPLSRASETMERMRQAFGMTLPPVVYDDRLKEISFGTLEGKLHAELPKDLAVAPGERQGSYWYYRPPQGESYQDVAQRLNAFRGELRGPSVVVAHGGILRGLRRLIEDAPLAEVVNWPPPQGAIAHFTDGSMNMRYAEL